LGEYSNIEYYKIDMTFICFRWSSITGKDCSIARRIFYGIAWWQKRYCC